MKVVEEIANKVVIHVTVVSINLLTKIIESMIVKNCKTCAHRLGSFTYGKCMLSGYYCITERKHPNVCGRDFKGWSQRKTIFVRIKECFIGVKE